MDIRAKDTRGEFDHGVAEVDDGVVLERFHIVPGFVRGNGRGREDLQAAEAIEEHGDGAEVRVFAQ